MIDARLQELAFLIVDDSRVVIKMTRMMLADLGITNVDHAESAAEAEEKMSAKRYDILFLDWRMTGKSGVTLMQHYREDRSYDTVAFVIVSGEGGQRYIQEAMKSGATAYIVKPFKPDMLEDNLGKVTKWLEQRGRFGKQEAAS